MTYVGQHSGQACHVFTCLTITELPQHETDTSKNQLCKNTIWGLREFSARLRPRREVFNWSIHSCCAMPPRAALGFFILENRRSFDYFYYRPDRSIRDRPALTRSYRAYRKKYINTGRSQAELIIHVCGTCQYYYNILIYLTALIRAVHHNNLINR